MESNSENGIKAAKYEEIDGFSSMPEDFRELIGSLWRMEEVGAEVMAALKIVFSHQNVKTKSPLNIIKENEQIRESLKLFAKENEVLASKIGKNTDFLIELFNAKKVLENETKCWMNEAQHINSLLKEAEKECASKEREVKEGASERESLVRTISLLSEKCGRKDGQMKHLNEQLKQLEETFDAIKKQSNSYVRNNNQLSNTNAQLQEENKSLQRQNTDLQRMLRDKSDSMKHELDAKGFSHQVNVIKQEISSLKKELDIANGDIASRDEEVQRLRALLQKGREGNKSANNEQSNGTVASTQSRSEGSFSSFLQQTQEDSRIIESLTFQINQLKEELKKNADKLLRQETEYGVVLRDKEEEILRLKSVEKRNLKCRDLAFQDQLLEIHTDLSREKQKVVALENSIQEKETDYKQRIFTLSERMEASEKNNTQYRSYIGLLKSHQAPL